MDDLALLRLQIEWGADEALDDHPRDQFTPILHSRAQPAPAASNVPPAVAPAVAHTLVQRQSGSIALSPGATIALAADQAAKASDLAALHQSLDAFHACPLRATASTTVAASGNPAAGLVFIAEAPGPEDDRAGQAFTGPPGERLDRILNSASLSRTDLLITFLVPWRPPGGRPPNETELLQCLPFLHRLLALARPHHLILLGAAPLRVLTNGEDNLRKVRGKWITIPIPGLDTPIPALPMPAPDLWLSNPKNKQAAWTDLLLLKEALAPSFVRF